MYWVKNIIFAFFDPISFGLLQLCDEKLFDILI